MTSRPLGRFPACWLASTSTLQREPCCYGTDPAVRCRIRRGRGLMTNDRTYGARTIKRERRTKAQVEQLDQQIIGVLREDHPQSVRHVFYRMTDPRLPAPVEKSDRGYRHVQDRCVKLRRASRIPYGWIADATRTGYFTNTFASGADFVRRMAGMYRADVWAQADRCCEVWVESRSIAGVILPDCRDLAVSLYPSAGFASLSFLYDTAETMNEDYKDGRPVTVFYVGDFDPAGVLIDRNIEQELRQHLDPTIDMTFERLGITAQQIAELDLPTKPRKEGDRRSPEVKFTVEAEAMPARILRQLLRSRIEELLPARALEVARIAERSEKEGLIQFARLYEERS